MASQHCSACQAPGVDPGFIEDAGGDRGYLRWISGPLERGVFGGAKRMGKKRYPIEAQRCTECGHLDLYVQEPDPEG